MKVTKCGSCTAKCCRYFALEIDKPKSKEDFENIKWYLCHHNVSIFVEKKHWYLEIENECKYIGKKGECLIYNNRPLICREYGWDKKGEINCHIIEGDLEYEYHFFSIEEIDAYVKKRFSRKKKQ